MLNVEYAQNPNRKANFEWANRHLSVHVSLSWGKVENIKERLRKGKFCLFYILKMLGFSSLWWLSNVVFDLNIQYLSQMVCIHRMDLKIDLREKQIRICQNKLHIRINIWYFIAELLLIISGPGLIRWFSSKGGKSFAFHFECLSHKIQTICLV